MVVWVGADWDSAKCVVSYEVAGARRGGHVKRNPKDVARFVKRLSADEVVVGIESGDRLWQVLWRRAGAVVHVFDGKKARRFSESLCSSGARDDKRSAEDICLMVQSPGHQADANEDLPAELRSMTRLVQAQDEASQDVQRCEARLGSHLHQIHPALMEVVGSLQAQWLLKVLEAAPTPAAWAELDAEQRAALLVGSRRDKRDEIKQALDDDWGAVEDEEQDGVCYHVRQMVRALQDALRRKKAAQKALHEAVEKNSSAEAAGALHGVGDFLSANLAIALGDPNATQQHRDRVAVQLGAAPVTARSGTLGDAHPHVHMRRSASKILRKAGFLLGFQLVGRYRWAKAQFAFHMSRGQGTARAFRSVVRSFSRILHALIRDEAVFDEDRYIAALKAKRISWAMEIEPAGALLDAAPC